MSVEEFPAVALSTVAGIGPYAVPFSFSDPSHVVLRRFNTDGSTELVDTDDWTLTPTGAVSGGWTGGSIALTLEAATALAGLQIRPERASNPEQGWLPLANERERTLANQIDWLARAVQDSLHMSERAVRLRDPVQPFVAAPGQLVILDADGNPAPGPTADQIAGAQAHGEAAAASAALAARFANEDEDVPIATGPDTYSALHHRNKTAALEESAREIADAMGGLPGIQDLLDQAEGSAEAALTAKGGAETAQVATGVIRDEAIAARDVTLAARDTTETYAGIVARSTTEAGLTDPDTLTAGDLGYVAGSGDPDEDGLYEVQAGTPNTWLRVGDTGLAGKADAADLDDANEFSTARQRAREALTNARAGWPLALIVVLLGQSLNASRDFATPAQRYAARNVLMPVGGPGISVFDFTATNVEWTPDQDEFASWVALDEGADKQSPAAGLANALAAGPWKNIYIVSAAIGGRRFGTLQGGGPRAALSACIRRSVQQAIADGYDPLLVFSLAQGEADASAGTSEEAFYLLARGYMRMAQRYAAQEMGRPGYTAWIGATYPLQSNITLGGGEYDDAVKEGLRRALRDTQGAIDCGPVYQWPQGGDLVHPTAAGYVHRGENVGREFLAALLGGGTRPALHMIDVTLNGDQWRAVFSEEITRDATLPWGTALPGTEGFEWSDAGTPRTISGLVYEGCVVRGTVTGITGTLDQQILRYAMQGNTPNGSTDEVAGGYVRATAGAWRSWLDPTFVNYKWAIPQMFSGVRAV